MADEEGKDTPKTTPPTTPPPIITQVRTRDEGRQWVMLLVYLLIALVVAAGVVLGGRWVYNKVRNEPAQETTATSNKVPEPPATSGNQSSASSQKPANRPSPSPTPGQASQDDRIADTGPGETVAIFISVSVVVAGLHYIVSLRRREV